ncbi:9617_t:CDS:2 [Funneliformis geosporum]|uniref:10658_t:CDS:1 n=1 Tax=Funneliformis geosporum TaxID=1117311 RepID=A0A9W4SYN9_9GLOM|nr:9617_t:CDS:2 [Funneliformis geosporum]CAI2185457.1 10658_t:CDS:2 [Funneliformis geosporum]
MTSISESSTLFDISNHCPHRTTNMDCNNSTNNPSTGVDFKSEYFQYSSPIQQYSSHGKIVPPPPPPMEMDILEDDQMLSSDEFNSIFESFATVVEGQSPNNNNNINYFNEDGCLNYSNGLLEDEQLAKALSVIAMI